MIGFALALGLMAGQAAPEASDFATRMRDSAAAAQALQGPLDGTWTLWDRRGRPLYVFQFTDPAGAAAALEGAWRRSGALLAPAGMIDAIVRRSDRLTIRFDGEGEAVRVRLRRGADGAWTGEANENGQTVPVALRRAVLGPTSP